MYEIFIYDKSIEINIDFIKTFLESNEFTSKKCKEKQEYLKDKIFNFCDDFNEGLNLGIKKIPKEENIKGILSHNGFLVIKFDWIYKNLYLLYLGFFKYENKFLLIEFNRKYLTYFLTQPKKEFDINENLDNLKISSNKSLDKFNFQKEDNEKKEESIFTFHESQKLIDIYLKQF